MSDVWPDSSITAGEHSKNQKHNHKGFRQKLYLQTADGLVYVKVGGLNILCYILKVSGHWIIIHTIYNRHRNVLTASRHISVKPKRTQLNKSGTSSHHTNKERYCTSLLYQNILNQLLAELLHITQTNKNITKLSHCIDLGMNNNSPVYKPLCATQSCGCKPLQLFVDLQSQSRLTVFINATL